jgi:hypothetical protein
MMSKVKISWQLLRKDVEGVVVTSSEALSGFYLEELRIAKPARIPGLRSETCNLELPKQDY